MPDYCVNKNTHEVHRLDKYSHDDGSYDYCPVLPDQNNQHALGWHRDCHSAVAQAESDGYDDADGCGWCSPDCHNG